MYLARVIPAFVMYCVNGVSRSSLLIESTESMIRARLKAQQRYYVDSHSKSGVASLGIERRQDLYLHAMTLRIA